MENLKKSLYILSYMTFEMMKFFSMFKFGTRSNFPLFLSTFEEDLRKVILKFCLFKMLLKSVSQNLRQRRRVVCLIYTLYNSSCKQVACNSFGQIKVV
jgi:hypothetical protein